MCAIATATSLSVAESAVAQGQPPAPLTIGSVTVSGSLRTRVESWDWFGGDDNGEYVYPGSILRMSLGQSKARVDWQVELAAPFILGLPEDAVVPGAQGALGMGANYFGANDRSANVAALFLKQGFVRVKRLGGVDGQSLKVGRMEFIDGAEVSPKNAALAAVKRDRIAHRLLGNFGFTHVGRSIDGVLYAIDRPGLNVTALGGRATQGVFRANGWPGLDVTVAYVAATGQTGAGARTGEWRLFGLAYHDGRDRAVKTDNRPLGARQADGQAVFLATIGGHYLRALGTPAGPVDVMLWGASQFGAWGELSQRAVALSAEGGWQPDGLPRLAPWIRGGLHVSSGDGDSGDTTHGTFFPMLLTPRPYARFPFFTTANVRDAFGEVILRPSRSVTIRTDVHSLRLTRTSDLWYQGGGAFEPSTFGYAGRPSNGSSALATLVDASVDAAINSRVSVGAYLGYASGGRVIESLYGSEKSGRFGYLELLLRF